VRRSGSGIVGAAWRVLVAVAMPALDRLRDELRAVGSRWSATSYANTDLDRRRRLGYLLDPEEPSLKRREAAARMMRANSEARPGDQLGVCDLRSLRGKNYVPPVRDGSCAIAPRVIIEVTSRIAHHNMQLEIAALDLEEMPMRGRSWLRAPLAYEMRDASGPGAATPGRVRSWRELHRIAAMKAWIATYGPLLTILAVREDLYAYASGVYHHVAGEIEQGQCVVVIGFDDSAGYWIVQNTWGTAWGEHGYVRIAFGECGVDASMWGVEL
jgi:hypothetical protein